MVRDKYKQQKYISWPLQRGKAVASRNKCTEAKIVMFISGGRNQRLFFCEPLEFATKMNIEQSG